MRILDVSTKVVNRFFKKASPEVQEWIIERKLHWKFHRGGTAYFMPFRAELVKRFPEILQEGGN